jgi:hypothetical protein
MLDAQRFKVSIEEVNMGKKTAKQMARMVDSVQPHCEEKIVAAMTCSHAGSMSMLLASKLIGGRELGTYTSELPNPVFIAVGSKSIFAFKYAPRFFKYKIKKQVTCWPKKEVRVKGEIAGAMATFVITTKSKKNYAFEIPTMMGGKDLVDEFFQALGI